MQICCKFNALVPTLLLGNGKRTRTMLLNGRRRRTAAGCEERWFMLLSGAVMGTGSYIIRLCFINGQNYLNVRCITGTGSRCPSYGECSNSFVDWSNTIAKRCNMLRHCVIQISQLSVMPFKFAGQQIHEDARKNETLLRYVWSAISYDLMNRFSPKFASSSLRSSPSSIRFLASPVIWFLPVGDQYLHHAIIQSKT